MVRRERPSRSQLSGAPHTSNRDKSPVSLEIKCGVDLAERCVIGMQILDDMGPTVLCLHSGTLQNKSERPGGKADEPHPGPARDEAGSSTRSPLLESGADSEAEADAK